MSGVIFLLAGLLALLVAAIVCVPIISARFELQELRRRYELSDEEVAAYVSELPEVCHAVADSLGEDASAREIKRIASESTIMAILRQRGRRRPSPPAVAAPGLEKPAPDRPAGLTRESLRHKRRSGGPG